MIRDGSAIVDVFVVHPLDFEQERGCAVVFTVMGVVFVVEKLIIGDEKEIRVGIVNPAVPAEVVVAGGFLEHFPEEFPVGLQGVTDALGTAHTRDEPFSPYFFVLPTLRCTRFIQTIVVTIRHRAEHGGDAVARLAHADPVEGLVFRN